MKLDIISYHDLISAEESAVALARCEEALQVKGILGVKNVPD